jgi:hypothetical protein
MDHRRHLDHPAELTWADNWAAFRLKDTPIRLTVDRCHNCLRSPFLKGRPFGRNRRPIMSTLIRLNSGSGPGAYELVPPSAANGYCPGPRSARTNIVYEQYCTDFRQQMASL